MLSNTKYFVLPVLNITLVNIVFEYVHIILSYCLIC